MKKIISLLLVTVMMFALVAAAIPANASVWGEDVEALYFDTKPFIDGYITEAEWGAPTTTVRQSDAVTVYDNNPGQNRFFHNLASYDASTLSMEYTLWLRWNEDYFYIGVKASDPDGHSLKNVCKSTWDGDAFECRIDPEGVIYDDFESEKYRTDDYKPWSSTSVCDLMFGYCEMAGGFSEAFDYNNGKGMTSVSNNPLGICKVGIAPTGYSYSEDTANGITTYEIAIPWAYIETASTAIPHEYYKYSPIGKKDADGNIIQGPKGAISKEYGMSTVLFNADGASGAKHYNALLSWGSGVCSIQQMHSGFYGGLDTCGGSNPVTLVATKVSEAGATGVYDKKTEGGIPSKDVVANYATEIDKSAKTDARFEYKKLTYDTEDDLYILGYDQFAERIQLEDGNWVIQFDKDPGTLDNSPTDSGLHDHNYLSTEGNTDDPTDNHHSATNCSYTMEFDIKVTGLEQFQSGYSSALYNWFGGTDTVSFACGYFFDDGKFAVVESSSMENLSTALQSSSAQFTLNEWHHIVFQYDDETCVMRYYFDPETDGDHVSANAVPMFSFRCRYFNYGGADECAIIFRRMNCQIQLDNIQYYNFVDWTAASNDSGCKEHVTETIPAVEPTCTTNGSTEGFKCSVCGEIFTVPEKVDALGHDYESVITAPTATSKGYTTHTCTRCGDSYIDSYTDYVSDTEDFEYNVNDDGTATIIGYTGSATELDIPSELDGHKVTSIGNDAFYGCASLTNITIPNNVTSIGAYAFNGCTSLTSVTIPDSVTTIGYSAFNGCTSLTGVTIPDSVTSIGDWAFCNCSSLTSIAIPDGVASIGCRAFEDCTSLASITISDSVTSVESKAFNNTAYYNNKANWENGVLYIGNHLIKCDGTFSGEYVIKDGTKTIADSAFYGCASLTSITIPNNVTSIGDTAFCGCTSLANITIPDSVTSIESKAFDDTAYYNNKANWENGVLYIGNHLIKCDGTFSGEYVIKDGTKTIAGSAFYGCESLVGITISDSVTSIGDLAFDRCTSLENITIPKGVTSIGVDAFYACTSLESITIPSSVTSIGKWAFGLCSSLEKVYYAGSEAEWEKIEKNGNDFNGAEIIFNCDFASEVNPGDLNSDGQINMKDIIILRKTVAGILSPTDVQLRNGDLNGDGNLNMKDIILLRKTVAGVI